VTFATQLRLARLSDAEILEIFRAYESSAPAGWLANYARAVLEAPRRDFMLMRALSLILISKHQLQPPAKPEQIASPAATTERF
jgi:hypothetical protein